MSQIVALTRSDFGLIFADSNIVKADNTVIFGENRKVFKGNSFLIATAGLAYGIYVIEGLLKTTEDLDATDINYLGDYLLKIGNSQYQSFIRGNKNILSDYLRIYFILIAVNEKNKLTMKLIGAEGYDDLREFPIGSILTIPRRISLELGLSKIQDESKEELINFIEIKLQKISEIDKTVSPPFFLKLLSFNIKNIFSNFKKFFLNH